MTNPDPGFIAIRKQIFSHFDHNTLKVCQELFGERNGEDWNEESMRAKKRKHLQKK